MEHLTDKRGRISRSPDVVALLAERADQVLSPMVRAITFEEQQWSAGGGVHLSGTWRATETPVLIKLGVDSNQLYWMRQIAAAAPNLVPMLYASGDQLGELRIGWTVMERVEFGPLGPSWNGGEFEMLLEAAVRFQRAARNIDPCHITTVDAKMLHHWLEVGLAHDPPGPIKLVVGRMERDFEWVAAICQFEICHGDVHMCNALTRTPPPQRSNALLIDCQPIIQPWAFDAAYPQMLNSTDTSRVGYLDLVQKMSRLRSDYGMHACKEHDLEALSSIVLAWFAIRLWGLCPDRHSIIDYRDETERYIAASAVLPTHIL